MTWEWVALILGLAFNLTIIMISMSEGAQDGLRGYAYWRSYDDRGTTTKVQESLSKDETQRRL